MRRLLLALLLAAGTFGAGCEPQVEEVSFEVIRRSGAEAVVVRLDRGSVRLREHAGAEVEIEVRRSARALSREAARSALEALVVEVGPGEAGGALRIIGRVGTAGVWRPGESLGLRVEVGVPGGTPVHARTGSGRIELRGLTGPVRAETASGRIRASSLRSPEDAGPIRLRTADGRIEGEDLEGRIVAESGDGRIRLGGRLTEVTAVTADGRIEVATAGAVPSGDWLLRTASGRVRLRLPASAAARLSVLGSGEPESEPRALAWKRQGPISIATMGDGSGAARIELRSDDGRARVEIVRGR